MHRLVILFILIFNINNGYADKKSHNKLFDLYPYGTKLSNDDILKIVGIPIPKPDIEMLEINTNQTVSNLYTHNHFTFLNQDALSMMPCAPTPTLSKTLSTKQFGEITSNNLRRAVGSPDVAEGHILYVKGYLRDINCHPIASADITIWQANAYGVFNDKIKFPNKYDPNFQTAGFTTTNNDGSFEFITIMPGSIDNQAPFINVQVSILNEGSFETQIFFPNHELNNSDIKLKTLPEYVRDLNISSIAPVNIDNIDEGFFMVVDLVANKINRY
jgi:protocatechuate 3,4-dioxygenase beta subunit